MVLTEIVDHILGFLRSENDYTTLETCSAIFPQHVGRHLYSHITFNVNMNSHLTDPSKDGNYVADPTKISLILIDHPHIANYVRSVRVFIKNDRDTPEYGQAELPVISSNLSILSQLESITLSALPFLQWTTLDPEFRTALQNSIRLPSIKEVDRTNIKSFPLDVLDDCKNLERLLLFTQCAGGEAVSTPRLCSFGIEGHKDLMMARIVPWISSTTLHSLSLRMHGAMDLPKFRTLIEACSATLVNLELDHRCLYDGGLRQGPIFPGLQLPLLEQVIIQDVTYVPYYHSSLPLLIPFFSSLQSTCSIRLCIHLLLFILPGNRPGLDWSVIAACLAFPVFRYPIRLYIHQGQGVFHLLESFVHLNKIPM